MMLCLAFRSPHRDRWKWLHFSSSLCGVCAVCRDLFGNLRGIVRIFSMTIGINMVL